MTTVSVDLTAPLRDAARLLEEVLSARVPGAAALEQLLAALLDVLRGVASDPLAPRVLPIEVVADPRYGTIEVRIRRGRIVDTLMFAPA